MNYHLDLVPERTPKPRQSGITMVMDKGSSVREIEDILTTSAEYIDIVKFGWATIMTALTEPAIALARWSKMKTHVAKAPSHKIPLAKLYTMIVDSLSLNQEERVKIKLAAKNESSPKTLKPGKNEVIEGLFVALVKQVRQMMGD